MAIYFKDKNGNKATPKTKRGLALMGGVDPNAKAKESKGFLQDSLDALNRSQFKKVKKDKGESDNE